MSDFGSLRIALSSLYAAQKGLETTGHNIANSRTDGYSRQTVVSTADGGPTIPAMFSRWQAGGYGVKAVNVQRVNDVFLSNRVYTERAASGNAKEALRTMQQLEGLFPEPGTNGLQQQLTDFWSSWDSVANHPTDRGVRGQLLAQANTVIDTMQRASSDMSGIREGAIGRLSDAVSIINGLLTDIAGLNKTIAATSTTGQSANDLLDQRDLLVKKVSDYVDLTVRTDTHGQVDLFVPGGALLLGEQVNTLQMNVTPDQVSLGFSNGMGSNLVFNDGQVAGLLSSINEVVPSFLGALDDLARTLRNSVNDTMGVFAGGLAPADQDQSAAGTLQFGLSYNGAAPVTISVAGADWSGSGGASALQTALLAGINADPSVAGKFAVSVSGGNGAPMRVQLSPVDRADRFETSDVVGNDGNARFFTATTLTGTIPTTTQDQSATPTLSIRVRLDGGAWSTVSIAGADWSGAGGAAALESALTAALPAGISARVTGGNGSDMRVALRADDASQELEVGAAFTGSTEEPGLGFLLSDLAVSRDRVGGMKFFTGTSARDLAINPALAEDSDRIAVGRASAGAADSGIALNLAALSEKAGGPNVRYREFLSVLGAAVQRTTRISENQDTMTTQVEAQQQAATGVNIDEEMIAMVQYQHAYAAAARYLSVINEMLDTLINRVGQ